MTQKTESKAITVMPDQEKEMIEDMKMFGWNLQRREDVAQPAHADSDATPSIKLHFVRSLDLPNLDEIKNLESQYHFGELPEDYKGGCFSDLLSKAFTFIGPFLTIVGIVLLIAGPVSIAVPITIGVLVIGVILTVVGFAWSVSIMKKYDESEKRRQEIIKKRKEIKNKLQSLDSQD